LLKHIEQNLSANGSTVSLTEILVVEKYQASNGCCGTWIACIVPLPRYSAFSIESDTVTLLLDGSIVIYFSSKLIRHLATFG